jgi:hypothetical protein
LVAMVAAAGLRVLWRNPKERHLQNCRQLSVCVYTALARKKWEWFAQLMGDYVREVATR